MTMQLREVKQLVAQGEGLHVEFKRKVNFPEKIVKEAVAFANTEGGYLLVGVEDNGTVTGVAHPDEDHYLLEHALDMLIEPRIAYKFERVLVSHKGDSVLVYHIPPQEARPYYVRTPDGPVAYVRVADRSVQASPQVREVMKMAKRGKHLRFEFGDKERQLLTFVHQHGSITLDQFAELAQVPKKRAARTLVLLVCCNVLRIEPGEGEDHYFLSDEMAAAQV